jgi:hypothetical protein
MPPWQGYFGPGTPWTANIGRSLSILAIFLATATWIPSSQPGKRFSISIAAAFVREINGVCGVKLHTQFFVRNCTTLAVQDASIFRLLEVRLH